MMVSFYLQIKIVILRNCYYLHDIISKHAPQNNGDFLIFALIMVIFNLCFSESTLKSCLNAARQLTCKIFLNMRLADAFF